MLTFAEISALTEKTIASVDLRNEPKELYDYNRQNEMCA